jgi:ATP-dependent helicase/nuclease subunit A
VEEGTEGVRVMTVHKAKGLEFPVVILADPTCQMTRDAPSRHVDPVGRRWFEPLCGCAPIELLEASDEELRRDRAEAIRVTYVAATRARDLLVAPVCGDALIAGWLDPLQPVLYPSASAKRTAGAAPGCPAFGDDSVLDRGSESIPPPGGIGSTWPARLECRRGCGRSFKFMWGLRGSFPVEIEAHITERD